MPGSAGETEPGHKRGLRDRPLGRIALFAAILVAALLVARSCGETAADVSSERAVEIATAQVDFEPTGHQIRLIKRGLQSREVWLVGLERRDENDVLTNATSVLVDADTGEVIEVRPSAS